MQIKRRQASSALARIATGILLACHSTPETPPFVTDCQAWCGKLDHCSSGAPPLADEDGICVYECKESHAIEAPNHGEACIAAFEEAMGCFADLTCADFFTFGAREVVPQNPCYELILVYHELCPGVFLAPDKSPTP